MAVERNGPAGTVRKHADRALDRALIEELLGDPVAVGRDLTVVAETGSTNADLAGRLRSGRAGPGSVLVAASQTAGRGRLGRAWQSAPGSSLSFSVVLQPPGDAIGFTPILLGLAAAGAIRGAAGLAVDLKWPNDLLVGDAKLGGILAEAVDHAVVLGCGLNITAAPRDLAGNQATCLADHGVSLSREAVLAAVLGQLDQLLGRWQRAGYSAAAAGLMDDYRRLCVTIGQQVRVQLPGGEEIQGLAEAVDPRARLIVSGQAGRLTISAGDVSHVRPVPPG